MSATATNIRKTTFYPESGSYKQDELNALQKKVVNFVRDYYPDKMGVIGMRTYFKRSPHNPRMEVLSKIIFRVSRIRERWVPHTIKVPNFIVEATFNLDNSITLSMEQESR